MDFTDDIVPPTEAEGPINEESVTITKKDVVSIRALKRSILGPAKPIESMISDEVEVDDGGEEEDEDEAEGGVGEEKEGDRITRMLDALLKTGSTSAGVGVDQGRSDDTMGVDADDTI